MSVFGHSVLTSHVLFANCSLCVRYDKGLTMLTAKQSELLAYIHKRLKNSGISPSFEEMKNALNLKSKSGVHRLVSALEDRGFIRRLPNRARALEIVKLPEGMEDIAPAEQALPTQTEVGSGNVVSLDNARHAAQSGVKQSDARHDIVDIPLHGRIAAGQPIEALEDNQMLPVPAALLGSGEHYALQISGNSMVEAGILDGDYALIRKVDHARDGKIVVALVNSEEATLKYLHHDKGNIRLEPANSAYDPIIVAENAVQIQGVLAGLLRRYH